MSKVRMQHRERRVGETHTIGQAVYTIDQDGCIECTPEEAAKLGKLWSRVVDVSEASPPPEPTPEPTPEPEPAEPPPDPEPEPAMIEEVTAEQPQPPSLESMTKRELLAMAEFLGLEVEGRPSKLKLVDMVREAKSTSEE